MGTIYISGIASDMEDVIRYWTNYHGKPNHVITSIFYRVIMARPWTTYLIRDGELEAKFREKLREMLRANPDLAAAVGDRMPEQGRVPSLVEIITSDSGVVGERLSPVFASQLKELESARARSIKSKVKEWINAPDEDEPEEDDP